MNIYRPVLGAASVLTLSLIPLATSAQAAQAAPALATAKVTADGAKLLYKAAAGQKNKVVASVTASQDGTELVYLIDDSVQVRVGNGCTYPIADDRTSIRCVVTPAGSDNPYGTLSMSLGDGNDNVEFHNNSSQAYFYNEFRLGAGKDTLDSSDNSTDDGSFVWGQAGNDRITTGSVATVQGGSGADTLTANGPQSDLDGGLGNDKIWGGVGTQYLRGGADDDLIHAGAGADTLYGGSGDDRLYGEQGADSLYGEGGDDYLNGGKGKDRLKGGPGKDVIKQ